MPQRRIFERELIVSTVCVIICVIFALVSTGREGTRKAMDTVAAWLVPLERPAVFVMDEVGNLRRWTTERRELLLELAVLREENRQMKMQSGMKISEEFKKKTRPENRYPVVFRDPRTWWEELRIGTQGKKFAPGSAVFDGSDLMGVITSQSGDSAWVRMITSANFYVPVVVEETREIGVVTGDNEGGVWLRYLPSDGDYKPGMRILTVLGSRLRPGLPIGVLTSERRTVTAGIDEYKVKPGANLFRLQYVFAAGGEGS